MLRQTNSEKGSVVLLALMILMLITMFGFSALNSSTTELTISHNGRCYKQNIYRAEAAVMEAGQLLETDANPETNLKPASTPSNWLSDGSGSTPAFNPETTDWEFDGIGANAVLSSLYSDNASGYTVVFEGLAPGASFNMSQPTQMWQYSVYGKSELCNGEIGVVAGYRRRF